MGLACTTPELIEKNLGDEGPASTLEESSLRLNNMKKSKNSPSSRSVEFSEAKGSERQTVSIASHRRSLLERL
jgi:hypothetical protein